jgi:hypothetical protein
MTDARAAFARECKKIHRDSLYNATGHFEAADANRRRHVGVRIAIMVFGAVGGLGALKDIGIPPDARLAIVGVASLLAGALGGLLAVLKSEEAQTAHAIAGKQFKSLQHDARRAHEVFSQAEEGTAFQRRVEELMQRYNELNESAPQIPAPAYDLAKKRIKSGEFEGVPGPVLVETTGGSSGAPSD